MKKEMIDTRFNKFHENNPQVYDTIVELARTAKQHGVQKISIEHIFNAIRWEMMMRTRREDEVYKLSNDFKSRYSRLIMEQEEDLKGFFTIRELRYKE